MSNQLEESKKDKAREEVKYDGKAEKGCSGEVQHSEGRLSTGYAYAHKHNEVCRAMYLQVLQIAPTTKSARSKTKRGGA
jgi:hypothetical protein